MGAAQQCGVYDPAIEPIDGLRHDSENFSGVTEMTVSELQSQAMQLNADEREMLAINLLSSLQPDEQNEIDEAWNREILARSDSLHAGTAITLDAWESLEFVRTQVRSRTPS